MILMRMPVLASVIVAVLCLSAVGAMAGPFDAPGTTTGAWDVSTGAGDVTSWADAEFVFAQSPAPTMQVTAVPGGDVEYGTLPPGDDSPEPATWALLLCTGALGGWIRRRRVA